MPESVARVGKSTLGRAYLSGVMPEEVQEGETLFRTMVVDDLKAHIQVPRLSFSSCRTWGLGPQGGGEGVLGKNIWCAVKAG